MPKHACQNIEIEEIDQVSRNGEREDVHNSV